jgi:DNA-binding CsgD family transcriptional regulator
MNGRGTGRLTEPQRIALRLFMERKTAKQIALELGITPKAVELRLKGARDAIGVATSAEAARWLAAAEQTGAFRETLGGSTEVADPALSRSHHVDNSESGGNAGATDRKGLSEARTVFDQESSRWLGTLGWPLPGGEDRRNDLNWGARLLWPFLAIFAIGVSAGTLVICGSLLTLACVAVIHLFH